MTRNESVIDHMCQVQHDQLVAFKDVTRNLSRLRESLARLDVNEMKREMVGAMRDMMREESVAQLTRRERKYGGSGSAIFRRV